MSKKYEPILIANPLYDTVFKYLMDAPRTAKTVISTIIGEEIDSLVFKQRERPAPVASLGVTVFRLDFSAVVKTADGDRKNVLIEIQKADKGEDIPRFRRYLAENVVRRRRQRKGKKRNVGRKRKRWRKSRNCDRNWRNL